MYRNHSLSVTFLPVRDILQSHSLDDSFDTDDLSVCGELGKLSSLDKETSQTRTSLWVLSMADYSVQGDPVAEELVSQDAG